MPLSPVNTVRCQRHKSSHYVRRIAVLSLTKSCALSWLKPDTKFLTLGDLFSSRGKKNVGSEFSHTIFQQFYFFKKDKKG